MSISLALGIVAIINLAIGYALALMIESPQQVTTVTPMMPPEVPTPIQVAQPQVNDPASVATCTDDPPTESTMNEPGKSIATEPIAPAADANDCAEKLLASTTALVEEIHEFAKPEPESAEPRAMLGDAGQLEAAIHEWWHNDPERARPICIGQIEIDNLRQLTSRLDAASLGSLTKQMERLVLSTLRRDDLVASLGRSRFLAVMPNVNATTAAQILEKLRARVENFEFGTEVGPIRATLSAAAAQSRNDDDVETLLTRSAAALREASNAGRNRVACHDGNTVTFAVSG
jgi:diguanylate cyclase (GGDEF)-like protein